MLNSNKLCLIKSFLFMYCISFSFEMYSSIDSEKNIPTKNASTQAKDLLNRWKKLSFKQKAALISSMIISVAGISGAIYYHSSRMKKAKEEKDKLEETISGLKKDLKAKETELEDKTKQAEQGAEGLSEKINTLKSDVDVLQMQKDILDLRLKNEESVLKDTAEALADLKEKQKIEKEQQVQREKARKQKHLARKQEEEMRSEEWNRLSRLKKQTPETEARALELAREVSLKKAFGRYKDLKGRDQAFSDYWKSEEGKEKAKSFITKAKEGKVESMWGTPLPLDDFQKRELNVLEKRLKDVGVIK